MPDEGEPEKNSTFAIVPSRSEAVAASEMVAGATKTARPTGTVMWTDGALFLGALDSERARTKMTVTSEIRTKREPSRMAILQANFLKKLYETNLAIYLYKSVQKSTAKPKGMIHSRLRVSGGSSDRARYP